MNTHLKSGLILIGVVILGVALYGGYNYPKSTETMTLGSTVGVTNSTQRIAQIVANNASNSTYVSGSVGSGVYTMATIANGDANDRVIASIDYYFDGLTTIATSTATLNLQAATSTDSTTLNSNTNYLLNTTIATSTPTLFIASTTPGLAGTNANRIWKAGTNLNFVANGTTTGNFIIKVNYIAE